MTREKKEEIVATLLNEKMNATLEMWANSPKDLKIYAWGWRDENTIGPNHHEVFYCCDKVIKILSGLDVTWYPVIGETEEGKPTPCIKYYVY